MRRASGLLFLLACAFRLPGQAPIGFGPRLLDTFSWAQGTANGCTAGPRESCVGMSSRGDTNYFTGWFANSSLLPNNSVK